MRDAGCLIIDDVAATVARLTSMGQLAAAEASSAVREVVLAFAQRRGWTVLTHERFTLWARQTIERSGGEWVILDPLFPGDGLSTSTRRLHLTRTGPGQYEAIGDWRQVFDGAREVGVLDDAVASGGTLRCVSAMAQSVGATVTNYVVCASRRDTLGDLLRSLPRAKWSEFLPGDWRIMHLRDGCPCLPFIGVRSKALVAQQREVGGVEIRTSILKVSGSLWQVICLDPDVRASVSAARELVGRNLSMILGREATVGDLKLLGASVAAIVEPGQAVTDATPLAALVTKMP